MDSKTNSKFGKIKTVLLKMSSKSNSSKRGRLDLQISSDHQGKKKFSSEICDKSFTQVTRLGEHISAIHEGKKQFLNVTFVTTAVLERMS